MFTLMAYIDPGAGSILLQTMVAGFAGFAVFGRYCLQRVVQRFRGGA